MAALANYKMADRPLQSEKEIECVGERGGKMKVKQIPWHTCNKAD